RSFGVIHITPHGSTHPEFGLRPLTKVHRVFDPAKTVLDGLIVHEPLRVLGGGHNAAASRRRTKKCLMQRVLGYVLTSDLLVLGAKRTGHRHVRVLVEAILRPRHGGKYAGERTAQAG